MRGAWSYSKYPLLKSKQEMEAVKDHIGTRQDPADLYVVPIYDENRDDIVFGAHTANNSNRNDDLRMYLAIHSFETLGRSRRRIQIQLLFILSDDMERAVTRE